jgi:putative redox protein
MPTISADLTSGFEVDITNGRHTWRADEPLDFGGTDTGPNPYELLLGSLAACACITLSMYASRKGIPVTSISARYTFEKLHADDCGFCEDDDRGFIDTVSSEIFVEGDFDDEARKRLAEVAVRCPVHKTLERGIRFTEQVFVG